MSETETAKVIRAFKTVQPDFDQHFFLKEVANYIIADLLEAYLSADVNTLKEWGTETVRRLLNKQKKLTIILGIGSNGC